MLLSSLTAGGITGVVLGALIIACAFIIGLFFLLGYITFLATFKRPKFSDPAKHPLHSVLCPNYDSYSESLSAAQKALEEKASEPLSVTAADGVKLAARFYKAENAAATVICMHGYSSTGTRDFANILPYYFSKSFNVLLPSERAHGESGGNYTGLGVIEVGDLELWVAEAIKLAPETKIFIHGISSGATTALLYSAKNLPSNVKGIIEDSGYTKLWDVLCYQIKQIYRLQPFPILHIAELFARRFLKTSFRRDSAMDAVRQAGVPILFIHGAKDILMPIYMCEALYSACTAPKAKFVAEKAGFAEASLMEKDGYLAAVGSFIDTVSEKPAIAE